MRNKSPDAFLDSVKQGSISALPVGLAESACQVLPGGSSTAELGRITKPAVLSPACARCGTQRELGGLEMVQFDPGHCVHSLDNGGQARIASLLDSIAAMNDPRSYSENSQQSSTAPVRSQTWNQA